jgi:hypothetical protein
MNFHFTSKLNPLFKGFLQAHPSEKTLPIMNKNIINAFLVGLIVGVTAFILLDAWVFDRLVSRPFESSDEVPEFVMGEMNNQLQVSRDRIIHLEQRIVDLNAEMKEQEQDYMSKLLDLRNQLESMAKGEVEPPIYPGSLPEAQE